MWLHLLLFLNLPPLHEAKTCPAMLDFLQKSLAETMAALSPCQWSALPILRGQPSPTCLKAAAREQQNRHQLLPLYAVGALFIRHSSFPEWVGKSKNINSKLKKEENVLCCFRNRADSNNCFSYFLPAPWMTWPSPAV